MLKTNAMRILDTAGVEYKSFTYELKQAVDAVSIADLLHKPAAQVFKTLVTEAPNLQHGFEHFVFVIPADKELSVKKAGVAANVKKIEMLPLKKLLPLTGYVHGGCSPLGMKKCFRTFIDETALLFEVFYVSGGRVGLTLEVSPEKLAGIIEAKFADLTL